METALERRKGGELDARGVGRWSKTARTGSGRWTLRPRYVVVIYLTHGGGFGHEGRVGWGVKRRGWGVGEAKRLEKGRVQNFRIYELAHRSPWERGRLKYCHRMILKSTPK